MNALGYDRDTRWLRAAPILPCSPLVYDRGDDVGEEAKVAGGSREFFADQLARELPRKPVIPGNPQHWSRGYRLSALLAGIKAPPSPLPAIRR